MKLFKKKSTETTHHTTHHAASHDVLTSVVAVVIIINLLLTVYVAFFKKDALWMESFRVGGKENFALVEKIYSSEKYKEQQTQSLTQYLGTLEGGAANNPTAQQPTEPTQPTEPSQAQTLDKTTMNKLFKDTLINGKQDARFVILEYSDLLCPFCQRHHNDKTLQKVMEKYPNDVALVFKNMPLAQLHPTAPLGAEATECAAKIGGKDAFFKYIDEAFKQQQFNDDNIVAMANLVGVDGAKLAACVKNGEFKSKIDGIISEAGTTFGVNGTPGNVIIDRQTGKYVVVAGAYPFEKFDTEIQALMK